MKTNLAFCTIAIALLFAGCTGDHGSIDMHKTLALVLILLIIALLFVLAIYSNLLRDQVDCDVLEMETEKEKIKGRYKFHKNNTPYSLSRVQLALWTVIISCSYIYLTFGKGGNCPNPPDINQTALILMGIGAAVTATGAIIDKTDIQSNIPRHQNTPSGGFFVDILSDSQGISIPRFQNVIWTGIAMIVYLNKVYMMKTGCALPELDQTLLALTGISNATYLALKSQENSSSVAPPTAPAQPIAPIPPAPAVIQPAPVAPAPIVSPTPPPVPAVPAPVTPPAPPVATPTPPVTPSQPVVPPVPPPAT
jgi:hypothetical protein